ncbi:MAG: hypothetical protein KKA65_03605 [Nanoarchaeota archaeon]|nr:hypothetical protein [Nanoarchaeota archaeon]MBU4241681.1 hypothetical protein [Nanoarchaeota archaeon]MBU4351706.1 hypothetical protein [Nanoarchaeota archaeon]MBU4456563.1 hypothetical protein [Nanoarchaeota archaeon]MCG2719930.1 hypothetical protein [Nanoarchaeota archaeon]
MEELKKDNDGNLTLEGKIIEADKIGENELKIEVVAWHIGGKAYRESIIKIVAPEEAIYYFIKGTKSINDDDETRQSIFSDKIYVLEFYKI